MFVNLLEQEEKERILKQGLVYETITGSTAYGLDVETSDIDKKGIVIVPLEHNFYLGKEWETDSLHNPDVEYHSLKKFMSLANTQNPTILEMLATREEFVTKTTMVSKTLRDNKDMFLSANVANTYGGYAREQLLRIKNALNRTKESDLNKYLWETMENIEKTFNAHYPNYTTGGILVTGLETFDGVPEVRLSVDLKDITLRELHGMTSEYTNATKNYGKMGSRNKRAEGKLTKHAMHLVRLLKCGIHALLYGEVLADVSHDRDFYLAIRNGVLGWEEIFAIVTDLELQLQQAKAKTLLPTDTNYNKINSMYGDLTLAWYNRKGA